MFAILKIKTCPICINRCGNLLCVVSYLFNVMQGGETFKCVFKGNWLKHCGDRNRFFKILLDI